MICSIIFIKKYSDEKEIHLILDGAGYNSIEVCQEVSERVEYKTCLSSSVLTEFKSYRKALEVYEKRGHGESIL